MAKRFGFLTVGQTARILGVSPSTLRLWENVGLTNDGKGQPQQVNAMSHGCSPSLFRRVNVLRTE